MAKIRVDIIGENGITSSKSYPIEDGNRVVLSKGRKGKGGKAWKPTFTKDCILPYKTKPLSPLPFTRLKQKLMIKQDASKFIDFFGNDGVEVPAWSLRDLREASKAQVIKAAGVSTQKIVVPTMLYLVVGISLILQVFTLFILNRVFRFV